MRTDSLKRLAVLGLSSEQMSVVLDVLAVELAPMERTRELAAQRQQRYVERNSNVRITSLAQRQDDVIVTPLAPVVDNLSKPSLEEVSKKESITSDSFPQDPLGFKEFWAVYPQRAGDRDRKPATKAFAAALKRVDLKTLLWATERYAADCKAKGKINTEYVKQARTWLNADGWTEYNQEKFQTDAHATAVHVKAGTPAFEAWEAHWMQLKNKKPPRDQYGGWYFPTEFPPQEQAA